MPPKVMPKIRVPLPKPPAPKPVSPAPIPIIESKPTPSFFEEVKQSRGYGYAKTVFSYRRAIIFTGFATYGGVRYMSLQADKRRASIIHPSTYLYWKIHDGSIVECVSTVSSLASLVRSNASGGGGGAEGPAKIMSLNEVIEAMKSIALDDKIEGLVVDFSSTGAPTAPSYTLGLAQLEELIDAYRSMKLARGDNFRSVAFTDSFASQSSYLLASVFDEVHCQPTGSIPLVGLSSTIPFFGRLLEFLGIHVHAEARNEYKSFVQPYIAEGLTKPQRENQSELINDLNDNLMRHIARNRYPTMNEKERFDKVKALSQIGPLTASQSVAEGLLTSIAYRSEIMDSIFSKAEGGDEKRKLKGFYEYAKIAARKKDELYKNDRIDVGVVYLLGSIGDGGEFGTSAVVKGLKEAGEDPSVQSVVLRIDSGGGSVIDSDTIWSAVRDLRRKGKIVVGSFGNASASGGYFVSTDLDMILASPSTITGSIGVAALRPSITSTFLDRIKITTDSFFTGSRSNDLTHILSPDEASRYSASVDEMYVDFKNRVKKGRGITSDAVMESIAGGRVMSGLQAFALTASPDVIDKIREFTPIPSKVEEVPLVVPTDESIQDAPPLVIVETDSNAVTSPVSAVAPDYGRGLIDALGGFSDAAMMAASLSITKAFKAYSASPATPERDLTLAKAFPTMKFDLQKKAGDGRSTSTASGTIHIRRFPRQRSFWEQVAEGAKQTDPIASIAQQLQLSASIWLLTLARNTVNTELEELGITRQGGMMGLGKSPNQVNARYEM